MARTPKPVPSNSLVASAANMSTNMGVSIQKAKKGTDWHADAWRFYDCIGEYRYSCDWVGNMLSKATLHATIEKDGKKSEVAPGEEASQFIYDLFGDSDNRSEMLRLIGIHMTVTGQCWIVGYPDADNDGDLRDEWQIVSSTRLTRVGGDSGKYMINSEVLDVDENKVMVIRVWRPHPDRPDEPISPTKAILPILSEIFALTQHVAAQVDSRLAGAGILLMPAEMTFPAPPAKDGEVQKVANNAEDLMVILQQAMAASLSNRGDASALVPIVITAPSEAISAVKHMKFWTDLDEHAIELRNEAIRRLALGMDMPPEVLQGISESNHWSAWQADESAIKSHTEPLLKMITTALADGYLRPALRSTSMSKIEVEKYSIGTDTSEMRLRPNRSKEALELYNLGALSVKALRRETGFDDDDAMDASEYAAWVLQRVASGSATPEMVEAAMLALKVPIGKIKDSSGDGTTNEARPAPSLKDHPTQGIPDQEVSVARKNARQNGNVPSATDIQHASLIAGAEQIVIRALERSGNKLKNKFNSTPTVAATELYRVASITAGDYSGLLTDAWSHVSAVAERSNVSVGWLEGTLDQYCRGLFATKVAHNFDSFSSYMTTALELGKESA